MTPTSPMVATALDQDGLFSRARNGDEDAWSELYNKCRPKVLRVVRRRLSPPMRSLYESTDFYSDVMKSLAASADRLDFDSFDALVAFLVKIAEQKVVDEYRRVNAMKRDVKRQQALNPFDGEGDRPGGLASDEPTASQFAVATEAEEQLLAGRTVLEREVIVMKHDGYSPSEISERVGWSLRTVQRFFKNLRDSFLRSEAAR